MKKSLRRYLLNSYKHLHLITAQYSITEKLLKIKNAVITTGGARKGDVYFFKLAER
jgi:hypothetical protein